jgi:hypothetical protein
MSLITHENKEWIPAFAGMTNGVDTDKDQGIPRRVGAGSAFAGMTGNVPDITQVYQAAIGKNLFTNSFLSCAANGNLFYKFRKLIRTLQFTNVKEIINSTELVMTMGETSGADQLTGFLIGMKRFLK